MRVIKHGKPPEKDVFRITCIHCKCEFEFERGEAKVEYYGQRDSDPRLTIHCPDCSYKAVYKETYA